MGILADCLSIICGCLLGSIFRQKIVLKKFSVFGISVMLISLVGFFENIFDIENMHLSSNSLMVIVFSLIIGSMIGEAIKLDGRLNSLSDKSSDSYRTFIDATLFFGIGGLQISGPIMLAATNDSSQLLLKSLIDFPFALMFGASYGRITSLSAIPVGAVQFIIYITASFASSFFSSQVINQIGAMGYIVLFFSGFNMLLEQNNKINNTNMIPGIIIILIYNAIGRLWI